MVDVRNITINKHYQPQEPLTEVAADPFQQFNEWFEAAERALPEELVNAMTLSTVGADYRPSARVVLLKQYDQNGFVFFSNYQSKKGQQIKANPFVALTFWWEKLGRQIRIQGRIEPVSAKVSDEYFYSRSRSSQIAAIVSSQSSVLKDLTQLQTDYENLCRQYADETTLIPRPAHWGGYLVKPDLFEFWQGGEHRLHNRFEYRLIHNRWKIERLAP